MTEQLKHQEFVFGGDPDRPSAHASTIVELSSGELLCAWYAGEREGAGDVAVLLARREPAAEGWGSAEVFAKTEGRTEGNPVLFMDPTERVWLFWVTQYGDGWDTCKLKYRRSEDGGRTWGRTVIQRDELGWMYRHKPIVLRSGRILLPLYDEVRWLSLFGWSDDNGQTWHYGEALPSDPGNIQPSPVQLADGRIFAIMRTGDHGHLWQAWSHDEGETWTKPTLSSLPNPNSGADMVRLDNGHLVLAFNNTSEGRSPLSLALSEDEGASWPFVRDLEAGPGEYSYPAIIQTADGRIHVTYTYLRTHIKHVSVREEWIKGADASESGPTN